MNTFDLFLNPSILWKAAFEEPLVSLQWGQKELRFLGTVVMKVAQHLAYLVPFDLVPMYFVQNTGNHKRRQKEQVM